MLQSMFETFDVKNLHVAHSSEMVLLACGRGNGLVIESGHGVTTSVPLYEFFVI